MWPLADLLSRALWHKLELLWHESASASTTFGGVRWGTGALRSLARTVGANLLPGGLIAAPSGSAVARAARSIATPVLILPYFMVWRGSCYC